MKKLTSLTMGILFCVLSSFAQSYDTTSFYGKMNYLYHHIDKTPVTTGLLRDYGMDFQQLDNYTGTALHDSNYTSLTDWRMLYASLYSQQITSTAGLLYLDTLNKRFSQYGVMGDPISFVAMYYHYQSINPDGISNNQFTISNDQLFDVNGRSGSPYLTHDVFAIATTRQLAITGDNDFIFKNDLLFGNTGKTISSIQVDAFGTGSYQTVSVGTAFTIHYDTAGLYNINIQITYTDNTVKYSHTKLAVHEAPAQARYGTNVTPATNETVTATKAYWGILGQGDITIDLAESNTTGQIRRPLIVVEGFDPDGGFGYNTKGGFLDRINEDINSGNTITLNTGLDDINDYDLIFVNWQNGTDYIQRNAFLLERVIEIVNARKTTWNGTRQDNVIIGMSMGGLVARYALRDMEVNSIAHETRLFISHDAPHNGANVPISYQAFMQYIAPWKVINAGGNFPWISWQDMFPDAVDAINIFNSPAAKQMLIQRYLLQSSGGSTFSSLSYSLAADNTVHNDFMNEMNTLGWPLNCRNVTLANGSCDGSLQFNDNSKMLSVYGEQSWTYFGGIWRSLVASLAGIVNATNIPTLGSVPINNNTLLIQFPLSLVSTKTNLIFDFGSWPVPPSGSSMLFQGDLYVKRKLFWGLFSTTSYIMKCHANSTSGMLALDNAPGGTYDLNAFGFNINTVNLQLHSALGNWINAAVHEPVFCFVPTVSSLAFNNPDAYYRSVVCDSVNCNSPSSIADFFAPQVNQLHISYTQASTNWIMQQQDPAFSCAKVCLGNLSINGENAFCSTSGNYSVANAVPAAAIQWSVTPSGVVTVNSPGSMQTTLTRITDGDIVLTASITNACKGSVLLAKPVHVGAPIITGVSEDYAMIHCSVVRYKWTAVATGEPTNYKWYYSNLTAGFPNNDLFKNSSANWASSPINDGTCDQTAIKIEASNICGTGTAYVFDSDNCTPFTDEGCSYGKSTLVVSPNPATGIVQIRFGAENGISITPGTQPKQRKIKQVRIVDRMGVCRKQQAGNMQDVMSINVDYLPKDVYTVIVFDGKAWYSAKLIKN